MYEYEYDDYGNNPPPYLDDKTQETAPYSYDEVRGDVTLSSVMEEQQPSTTKGDTHQQKKEGKISITTTKLNWLI